MDQNNKKEGNKETWRGNIEDTEGKDIKNISQPQYSYASSLGESGCG